MFNRSKMKFMFVMVSLFTLLCAWPLAASAASGASHPPILLKLDGIKGESQDAQYRDAIEINSFSFGVTNPAQITKGGGSSSGKATYSDIQLTKFLDSASLDLLKNAATGKSIKNGTLYFFKNGQDKPYLTIQLSGILVTSQQQSVAADGERMQESVSLTASKMTLIYTLIGPDGKETSQTIEIDLVKNTVTG
ncbi:Hcp family type VI secretion system effector [Paenibacillus kobensis]|uniref:Hcp family type VI secretion system effector n=1 Tax=Paenibacillus kobensis TaxID=59841 RepID=UPI000FD8EBC3|nr:type VI secretion system tube protein Hcp [Paenibacillus kobensis]